MNKQEQRVEKEFSVVRTGNWRFGEREMKRIEMEKRKTLDFCGENTGNKSCLENKMKMKP